MRRNGATAYHKDIAYIGSLTLTPSDLNFSTHLGQFIVLGDKNAKIFMEVGTVTWSDDLGFKYRQGQVIFLLSNNIQTSSGSHPSLLFNGRGNENDHLPTSGAQVKNGWSYTSTHPT